MNWNRSLQIAVVSVVALVVMLGAIEAVHADPPSGTEILLPPWHCPDPIDQVLDSVDDTARTSAMESFLAWLSSAFNLDLSAITE